MFGVSRTMTIDARSCHSPIRVLVADDHALFRETLRTLLETDPDIVVVGDASSGRDAIRLTRDLQPDILLLDLVMPNVSGLETLRELSALGLATRTLLLAAARGDAGV